MTKSLRVIDTGVKPARWNIAVTSALTELHRIGSIPDTLRFHRYPRAVLLGRHQVLEREVHADRCREKGVEIARRVTGGGAVYMSQNVLAWDIVAGRRRFGLRLEDVSAHIGSLIATGLARLGLACRFKAPGDIMIDGRKVSGSSGGFEGPTLVLQGTVLLDFDRVEMAELLKAQPGRVNPAPRVASLGEFLGRIPSIEEVQGALLAELFGAWGTASAVDDLRPSEVALAEKLLADEIGTEEFVVGQASPQAELPMADAPKWSQKAHAS